MKYLLSLILISISLNCAFGKIKVVKQGGKKCGNSVCYDYVQDVIHNNGDRNITCRNKGHEKCPTYGVVSLEGAVVDLATIVDEVEQSISAGTNVGSFDVYSQGQLIGTCTFSGQINAEGIVEFEALIDAI